MLSLALAGCANSGARHILASPVARVTAADASPIPRAVVYRGSLRVRVGNPEHEADRVAGIAQAAGGFVFARKDDLAGGRATTMTLKVPPDRFSGVLRDVAALGTVLDRASKAEDVTDKVVDLDGRLRSAQASADRLRGLIVNAKATADVVAIESELAKREQEIESLTGQRRVLQAQADLATLDVELTQHGGAHLSHDIPGFVNGLRGGWAALLNVTAVAITVAGALLPFAVVAGLFVPAYLTLRTRRRRSAMTG
jgi:hypothetical protein